MIRQGSRLSAFDLVRASMLSVLLFMMIGYVATRPNRHAIGDDVSRQANHGGATESLKSATPFAADASHRVRSGAWQPEVAGDGTGTRYKGPVHLQPSGLGWGTHQKTQGGPATPNGTLKEWIWQLAIISVIIWMTSLLFLRTSGIAKRLMLAAAALLGIFATVTYAQTPEATAPRPSFEVATIKPRDPKVMLMMTEPGSQDLVRMAGTAKALVGEAYGIPTRTPERISGGPDWIADQSKSYVVEGKIPAELFARMQTMSAGDRHTQANLCMQSLLAERFQLKVHFESREMPVYELIVAKRGAKLPAPNDSGPAKDANGAPRAPEMGGGEQVTSKGLRIHNMTLDGMLAAPWFELGTRPIVNKTGLTGHYNLTLNWVPDLPRQANTEGLAAPEGEASIFAVLQEQLGLKLVPTKAPVEVVVIDHIEQPSAN